MDEVKLLTIDNYKESIESMKYGYILCIYDCEETQIKVNKMFTILNEFYKTFAFEEKPYNEVIIENGEYVYNKVKDVYQLLYKNHSREVPILDKTVYDVDYIIKRCVENKESIEIKSTPELLNYFRKLARKNNLIYKGTHFDGREKTQPVMKRIENAYMNGLSNISFDNSEVKPATLRCYAFNYGSVIGKKIKVNSDSKTTTLHLNPLSEKQSVKDKIFDTLKEIEPSLCIESLKEVLKEMESKIPIYKQDIYDDDEF